MTSLLGLFLLFWTTVASAQSSCPAGKTNIGCAPEAMDMYGCCPAPRKSSGAGKKPKKTTGGFAQPKTRDGCDVGLLASDVSLNMCCWPGQGFDGVTCVGTPACPTPFVPKGGGCALAECDPGKVRADDALHCCWPGQEYVNTTATCDGTPDCPQGYEPRRGTCVAQLGIEAGPEGCAPYLEVNDDTAGMCCYEGQRWDGYACKGAPASCQAPMVPTEAGCALPPCRDGKVRPGDGLQCCLPGQSVSAGGQCTGTPKCPTGSELKGDACVADVVKVTGARKPAARDDVLGPLQWIPAGTVRMGPLPSARPMAAHQEVRIRKGFWMAQIETTQAAWVLVVQDNPSWHSECGPTCPVDSVSWYDAVAYANALSKKQGLRPAYKQQGDQVVWDRSANGWRLPTEAEWEYAARGGMDGHRIAPGWFAESSKGTTHAACGLQSNAFGLCDINGNVAEWVWDWAGEYGGTVGADHAGPQYGTQRILRGGSFETPAEQCTASSRMARAPGADAAGIGFRLVRNP